jgi:3'(2'), 5'-bisphosphate nucleotidase
MTPDLANSPKRAVTPDALAQLIQCCLDASKIIESYAGKVAAINADKSSPVTQADLESNDLIVGVLRTLFPKIPIISEEFWKHEQFSLKEHTHFWLVDPLDGTKEFLKNSGEYTINIALIEGNYPVFGIVHQPKFGTTYVGSSWDGAFRYQNGMNPMRIATSQPDTPNSPIATISKDHPGAVEAFITKFFPNSPLVHAGSAMKFLRLAEGKAHLYPRMTPCMEWDTAAPQAVLEAAGGVLLDPDGARFSYRKPDALNGYFVAASSLELAELCLSKMPRA